MANINYADQYLQGLQQKFAKALHFNDLYNTPSNSRVRWVNAKTVQIPRIDVKGFEDTDRDKITPFSRRVDNDWETMTLEHDRTFQTLVDPQDIDESNMAVTIANITSVFNSEQKIPEMDKYMASKLHAELSRLGGTLDTTVPKVDNALDIYDGLMEKMDEEEVPEEGRILYVTPAIHRMLKNAEKVQRIFDVQTSGGAINRAVRSLDDVKVVKVPSARMKTAYDFTDGAVSDGQQINMILVHPSALVAPQKYDMVSLDEPSAATGGKYLYFERKYWDVFIFERKVSGVKMNVEESEVEA